ncbi:MAG TPA: XRE family transcriptional regulator [Bryobacteraceae bacterium]|nr:XRE family transcriptional regulator [Bryobacteraceae bacterium]
MRTQKWSDLHDKMPRASKERVAQRVAEAMKEMPLHRLREARRLTQKQIAETLKCDQSQVSKMERRADNYVSTLRNFIEAMGGNLELVASFPDGKILINHLQQPDAE